MNRRIYFKIIKLKLIHKIKYLELIGGKYMNKKDNVVFIYDETAENIEDKILKIFKKYLEEVMK